MSCLFIFAVIERSLRNNRLFAYLFLFVHGRLVVKCSMWSASVCRINQRKDFWVLNFQQQLFWLSETKFLLYNPEMRLATATESGMTKLRMYSLLSVFNPNIYFTFFKFQIIILGDQLHIVCEMMMMVSSEGVWLSCRVWISEVAISISQSSLWCSLSNHKHLFPLTLILLLLHPLRQSTCLACPYLPGRDRHISTN